MNCGTQISDLYNRYAALIDAGELREVSRLLSSCTIYAPNGTALAAGEEDIFAMYRGLIQLYECGTPKTQHLVSNLSVLQHSDTRASASATYTVMQKVKSGEIKIIICGNYQGKFVLENQSWRFQEHHMIPKLIGDIGEHLRVDLSSFETQPNIT